MEGEKSSNKIKSASIGFLRFHGLGLTRILPRLYLSGEDAVKSKSNLKSNGITHILNLTTNVENLFEPELNYKKIRVNDVSNEDMTHCFDQSIEFIQKAFEENETNRVLVHCNAGVSRSASVVIAYLLKTGQYSSFEQAYEFLRAARPAVSPNPGFIRQLKEFESRIKNNKQ